MYDNPLLGPVVLVAVAKLLGYFFIAVAPEGSLDERGSSPRGKIEGKQVRSRYVRFEAIRL